MSSAFQLIPHGKYLHVEDPVFQRVTEIFRSVLESDQDPRRQSPSQSQSQSQSQSVRYNFAPKPVALEKHHLNILTEHFDEYIVLEKSDGVRYLLVLGTCDNSFPFCVMVDMRFRMYQIEVTAPKEYFSNSVFDGELVVEKIGGNSDHLLRQFFLIFDTIMVKNKSFVNEHFISRYTEFNRCFDMGEYDILDYSVEDFQHLATQYAHDHDKIVCLGNHLALTFRPKPCMKLREIQTLWRSIARLKHACDGIIFFPMFEPVRFGTHEQMFKWKPVHTLDLLVRAFYANSQWTYKLYYGDDGKLICTDDIDNSTITPRRIIINSHNEILMKTSQYFGENHKIRYNLIGEFKGTVVNNDAVVCDLIKWRREKNFPNNKTTVIAALRNIVENIDINDLLCLEKKR